MNQKIVLKSIAFIFALYSASATAGVGIHFIFDNNAALNLVKEQKIKIDEYDQEDDSKAQDPSSNWNAPHIQGSWQPVSESQIKYTEAPSGDGTYDRYFSVNLSSENKPVCLIRISGERVQKSGPRLKNHKYRISQTDFAKSNNIECQQTDKTLFDEGREGDTLYFHFNVGYKGTVPANPIDISKGASNIEGWKNAVAPYKVTCSYNRIGGASVKRDISFEVVKKYESPLVVVAYSIKQSGTNLYYKAWAERDSEGVFWAISSVAKTACMEQGGMPERLLNL